ncbi:heavy metal translocating P-type ATPase [Neolewinella antarctica]|uniref:Cu2+-exporting ATPase n=1 Tax=Neolewinella antarctica TaxID=442734 RepID=A0ABX0XA45_9BACT|nr:heavy metal translocating P-type ATPase [Neolewinella antarctica]NJC25851.1 Cu2+-exporting ATPase [Neolewinella antarctica]
MIHAYAISGMTCDHCVDTVQKALEAVPGVSSAEVNLDPPQAAITMHHHVSTEQLNAALSAAGNYQLAPESGPVTATKDHLAELTEHGHEAAISKENHQGMNHDKMDHGVMDHGKMGQEKMDHSEHEGHGNHGDHHRMMIEDFKRRFWVSLILMLPVLLLAPMIQNFLGVTWTFPGDRYLQFVLSSVIYFYGGWPFLKGLKEELGKRTPGMMTLIAVAITAAYVYSSAVVFGLEGKTFFWELASLIVVMLLGHWIEMRSVLGASKALEALAALMPNEATRIDSDGQAHKVPVNDLKSGDLILIKPGEKVPADGVIKEGSSSLNESMLTGESVPVSKAEGAEVIGGSINGSGAIKVEVKGVGEDSYLAKVVKLVQDAQGQKSKTQHLADRAAYWLTIIALVAGFGTFGVWMLLGKELAFALERMVTVMVICCPHALGLAIPLVAAISTSVSAKHGLLIRNRTAFENSRKITTIVFDKTGTLTKGSHEVTRVVTLAEDWDEVKLLRYATAVESSSEHHISKGLQRRAKAEGLTIPASKDFKYEAGVDVSGTVEGKAVRAGGYLMLEAASITAPADSDDGVETKIFLVVDDRLVGFITFADQIRESSAGAIDTLQKNGIKCLLLTGDNERVAASVAKELGMDDYLAEVLPDQKQDKIKELQAAGEFVAMTGDGVNDAPALARADVGIAIGSGTDVAAETADIVLVDSDPKDIANLILFGKATYRKMIQNLWWATGYNAVALPLATGFVPGFVISPAVGAALMSISTVICAVNAQLLKGQLER